MAHARWREMSVSQPLPTTGQVLLVEDDESARDMFAAALRLRGYHVRTAADGLAALRLLDEFDPDVVVVDLSLPIASGFEVLHEIRAAMGTRNIPVIAISGHERGVLLAKENPEFFAALQKPFDPEALLRTVARAVRQRQQAT
jgi:two-component system cell cycle response regulator DivK